MNVSNSSLKDAVKKVAKRYKLINSILAQYRKFEFAVQVRLRQKFLDSIGNDCVIQEDNLNIFLLSNKSVKTSTQKIKAIWLGADPNQDGVGFLNELKSIVDLTVFQNIDNKPCLYYQHNDPSSPVTNSIHLLKFLQHNESCELVIGQFWPDLIDLSYEPLILLLKQRSIKLICIAMDDYMPERWLPRKNGIIAGPAGHGKAVSLYATSDLASVQRYHKLGLHACYLPFGCSLNLRQKSVVRDIDVLFVGSNYGRRSEVINYLLKNGVQVTAYGPGFEQGRVSAEEIAVLYSRAKIVLGICNVGFQIKEVNLKTRDFDAISCGALVVSNACDEFNINMIPGLHYIQYFELSDLLRKIQHFLRRPDEARRIAEFGYEHGLKNHLWRDYLKKVIYDIP